VLNGTRLVLVIVKMFIYLHDRNVDIENITEGKRVFSGRLWKITIRKTLDIITGNCGK
jgi:hypothetical protein